MDFLGKFEVEKSWTRYRFNLSASELDSLRTLIEAGANRSDYVWDDHHQGFIREFADVYSRARLSDGESETWKQIISNSSESLRKTSERMKVIPLD